MILNHYTAEPFTFDAQRTYQQEPVGNGKPHGLWLSDDSGGNGWKDWCERENWGSLTHRTQFETNTSGNLILIDDEYSLNVFELLYSRELAPAGSGYSYRGIDWARVTERFDGIVIAPYRRIWPASVWYSAWDCDSACIWNQPRRDHPPQGGLMDPTDYDPRAEAIRQAAFKVATQLLDEEVAEHRRCAKAHHTATRWARIAMALCLFSTVLQLGTILGRLM